MNDSRSQETAVLLLTDVHYGRATPSFNPERCKARIRLAGDRMAAIRSMLAPSVAIDRLVVLILGDVNDGTDIYAGQAHEQAVSDVQQQAQECAEILRDFFIRAREVFGSVEAYTTCGNHGRVGRKDGNVSERASWDSVCYRYLQLHLAPLGIHIDIDDQRPFLRVVNIRGHGVLLHHGHFVNAGILPGPALVRRLVNWSVTSSIPPFELAVMGHFHNPCFFGQSSLKMLVSGTIMTDDPYALEKLGVESPPAWWFFGVSNSHIPSWQFLLDLDDRRPGVGTTYSATPNAQPTIDLRPNVHGRDVIVEPVQASARIVSSATPTTHESKPPVTNSARVRVPYGTCQKCHASFAPTWNTQKVCPQCREIVCANPKCAKIVVMEKYEATKRFCSTPCYSAHRQQHRRSAS